jgi:DNA-binding SARP family transcriptional activator/basic membrane lipoprotein Med (substrate-binding protein (PBP1-ABC) superfamily)
LRILGGLEAELGGRALELGGGKQRAVLAALLLLSGEVVPVERLFDGVWGEDPPASAAHTLESYVSRLRRTLSPYGVAVERRGNGYRLDLGEAVLDSQVFEVLVDQAAQALAAGDHRRAASNAKDALSLWHGPVLADVTLHLGSRAEAEQLDELRSRAFEIRIEADLALGRHTELVGELRRLLEGTPYRERLVAQLMVALYRSGRHAEALEVYERTRRDLEDDLGLRPGEELQRLAGQIVRQEPLLRTPAQLVPNRIGRPAKSRARRGLATALAGALAVAATTIAVRLVLTDSGLPSSGGATRVALIRMWDPGGLGSRDEAGSRPFVEGLLEAEGKHELEAEIVDLFPRRPPLGGFQTGSKADVDRLSARLRSGKFDLVLWPLGLTGPRFFDVVPQNPDTRFVFLDYCCAKGAELGGAPNVTALSLRAGQAAHLAGYLSGLMEARRRPLDGRHVVSIISGEPNFPQQQALVQGFSRGARRALPDVEVRSDYSFQYDNQATCERIANRQIDAGSGVVFAAVMDCGLGALSAAAIRGVWGVASGGEDLSHLGPHILASASERYARLVDLSVSWYLERRLPPGGDVELGLVDDTVALVGINPDVPPVIRSKVAQEAARLRAQEARESSG